ncbi:hypothetical protein EV177_004707 [Coemansia sp. RSA 1804]|nr:hypothetical protein EV177_004707 [Coemansia sp. RSA 1804]
MFRSLLHSATTAIKVPAPLGSGASRTYVTRKQTDIMKKVVINSNIEINKRTNMPMPVVTAEERQRLRSDPLLSQLVNMIMRNGEKMKAERFVQLALRDIRQTSNSDPYKLLSDAIDLASPMMETKSTRIGSKVVHIPRALNIRQRRRRAIVWLLAAVDKRKERSLFMRLSGELQAIVNGTSGILEKKLSLHKTVLANRSNIRMRETSF